MSNPKRATCRFLKYYYKFASRVRSLVPQNDPRGSYLSFPVSSCSLLRPSPLHSVFTVEQLRLARWLHVRCFLSLPLTLPTQCSLLPWNVAKSSETSCCIRQGTLEACRLFSLVIRLVGSQASPRETSCRNSSYLQLRACIHWEYASTLASVRSTFKAERRAQTARSDNRIRLSAPADAGSSSHVSE